MITPEEVKEIIGEVVANNAKLMGCERHNFIATGLDHWQHGAYRCTYCGGEVNQIEKHWYERGLAHAEVQR